ncbi:hypothetical protein BCR44DRAFT_51181 [Catenaria anguillulae PL171]|uniref:Uncharacterized protein n=1 Tax=Catenaria anguillulae PL171 TaxID=765915 RepID=A0A1Y2I5H6_9FUNG|nr:hypothetical protein BCR44DRAFT_51181 [Catenaria anguillulae PL171]
MNSHHHPHRSAPIKSTHRPSPAIEAMVAAIEDHIHALAEYIQVVYDGNANAALDATVVTRLEAVSEQLSQLVAPSHQQRVADPATAVPSVSPPPGYVRVPVVRLGLIRLFAPPIPTSGRRHDSHHQQGSVAESPRSVYKLPAAAHQSGSSPPKPKPIVPADHVIRETPAPSVELPQQPTSHSQSSSFKPPSTPFFPGACVTKAAATVAFKGKSRRKPRPPPLQALASYLAIGPRVAVGGADSDGYTAYRHEGHVSR